MKGREAIRRNSITSLAAGDHAAAGGERLGEGRHPQIDVVLDAEQLAGAGSAGTEHAEAVRLVDHQPRAVLPAERDDLRQRGDVALHRVDPVDNYQEPRCRRPVPPSAASRAGPGGCDGRGASSRCESRQPSRIDAWSPESAMTVSCWTEDRAQRAEVGLVTGREHDRVLGTHPVRELALELDVKVDRAVEEARAGEAGPVAIERVAGALLDALVAGQSQVVVGAEHDPALALHLDDRQRRTLEHVEVGELRRSRVRALQLLEALELASLREDVDFRGPAWRTVIVKRSKSLLTVAA